MSSDIKASSFLDYAKSKLQGKGDFARFSYQSDKQYKENYDKIFRKEEED